MDKFLAAIDKYIHDETPDFWEFYRWFQDAYFGDQHSKVRNRLQQGEIDFLNTVNDLLAYAGADPTPEERNDGINDQHEFQRQLRNLRRFWPGKSLPVPQDKSMPPLQARLR
jgi:hypothetical protein